MGTKLVFILSWKFLLKSKMFLEILLVSGMRLWNMLPMSLKSCLSSSSVFRSGLKTYLLLNYDNLCHHGKFAAGFELLFQHLVSFLPS